MEITPKLRNGLIIGGLLVATVGVIAYVKRQINLLMDSCYTISGGVLHNLSLSNVKITLFFKIKNESDLTINISDLSLNLYVNNMFVTKIEKPETQTIYSKSDTIIKIDFEFNPKDLLRAGITNISPILYDKEKLVIQTKGTMLAKTGIVKTKLPIDEKITLKDILTPNPNAKKC